MRSCHYHPNENYSQMNRRRRSRFSRWESTWELSLCTFWQRREQRYLPPEGPNPRTSPSQADATVPLTLQVSETGLQKDSEDMPPKFFQPPLPAPHIPPTKQLGLSDSQTHLFHTQKSMHFCTNVAHYMRCSAPTFFFFSHNLSQEWFCINTYKLSSFFLKL